MVIKDKLGGALTNKTWQVSQATAGVIGNRGSSLKPPDNERYHAPDTQSGIQRQIRWGMGR